MNGSSDIRLHAEGTSTVLDVTGTVQTGGPIARLGQRPIGGVSEMMLDRFFACLRAKLALVDGAARRQPGRPLRARALKAGPGPD